MTAETQDLAVALFSEMLTADQMARNRLSKLLPKGMELSHFAVLNHLAHIQEERTPARLAQTFNVTRGAMTNTISKLEWAGHVHVRPDWDDARRKLVSISPSGRKARDTALTGILPLIIDTVEAIGKDKAAATIPVLREMRNRLAESD